MAASLAAPDPSGPNSGTRLPPWVSDGETFTRPGMKEVRSGEPGIGHLRHPGPCEPVFLAAPPQRAPPQVGHMVAEGHDGTAVRWHRMVSKVAVDHLPQPAPLDGDRLMHAPPQRVLDPPQRRPHAVGATVPLELEGAPAGSPADVGEPQEADRLRLAEPALGAPVRREAAKRDQAGLVRMQRQRKLLQARAHRVLEAPGIGLVLETDHDVIRVADDHHVARGLPPSPALGPEVEHVVQVDVGQERRDHSSHAGAKLPFDLAVTILRDRLRPHYGDGFLGAPLLLCRPSKARWPDHGGADATAQDKSPNPQGPGEP